MRTIEYKYWVAFIYILVLFLDRLDITIVNITLPTLAHYFHVPIADTSVVNTSFLLALAISIPIAPWLSNRLGSQQVFIAATALFGLTAFLCAFAPDLTSMTILRYLQGIGGGIIIPVGMTMVYHNFAPEEYANITSYIFMPSLLAPALAPALGGAFIKWLNWQWVFLFAAPICLLAIILSLAKLREEKNIIKENLDWLGFLLIGSSLSLLFYTIDLATESGLRTIIFIYGLLAIILLALFIRHENKISSPLIDINFFKNELFVQANFIQLFFQFCHYGSFFLIGIYLQVYVQMSALSTGIIIGMQAIGSFSINRYSVKLFNNYGARLPLIVGLAGNAVLSLGILWINSPAQFMAACLLLFARGIFSGMCGVPLQIISIMAFNKQDLSKANALFNINRQLAISLSIALFSLLIAHNLPKDHVIQPVTHQDFYTAFLLIPLFCLAGIIFTLRINSNKVK